MSVVEVTARFACPREVVWTELAQIERHVRWMSDAVSIDFITPSRQGVGTSFRCKTKVGPFVTNDLMTITDWSDNTTIGVTHQGLVGGRGSFSLDGDGPSTTLTWREQLTFPWWAFGPLGAALARPVLTRLWTKNLRQLGDILAHGETNEAVDTGRNS